METKERFFSVSEAAWLLGVSPQAVSSAIQEGRLPAVGGPRAWRIPASALVAYAVRSGWKPEAFARRLKEGTQAEWEEVLLWVLLAFGLAWLVGELTKGGNR